MATKHEKPQDILEKCLEHLDEVANIVTSEHIEPAEPILKNIGMAIGHILHAKKQIKDNTFSD